MQNLKNQTKAQEWLSYKNYILNLKDWDKRQFAMRSHLFKNPLTRIETNEKNRNILPRL